MSLKTYSDEENLHSFKKMLIEVERRKELIQEQIAKLRQDQSILVLAGAECHNEIQRLTEKLGLPRDHKR